MTVDATQLKDAITRACVGLHAAAPELNALDGRLGDGDLGATLDKCATEVEAALPLMSDTLTDVFRRAALGCANASGSSFGTLLAQALLTAAKQSESAVGLTRGDLVAIIRRVTEVLCARGGAKLGDKTVLDALNAVGEALEAASASDAGNAIACKAIEETLVAFRGRPNRIGRARMFAERSQGQDDPGMVALLRMAQSL
ncbi:PTS-dependent dihydroxyacetone kinase, ADP-binding subunit DhaL [Caballeronia hypogeia]|uniref:PTS-dependent dihydroxyacetone kinase, ADP-binding subunit DhaL n=1 Tax=Caballeronia hypogeia TaxID=1777140 RepID=A0A158CTG3_9BURK|nr:DAK2 domain-containing protein [Caballeronia hypogeia]SAK85619.1 PTS-dependent dihydroxyacetone kinase, ADP-binding subunit DhaL [Caballeronia hypogeia]